MLSATPVAKATIRQQQASHRATLASRLQQSRMFHSLRSSSVYVPRSQAGACRVAPGQLLLPDRIVHLATDSPACVSFA